MAIDTKRGICEGEHPFRPSTLNTPSRARNIANIRMYKCTNMRADVKKCSAGQIQSSQKFQLRALANHLFYFGYGIAERLPIAASPGGRSRTRAEGSEQDGRLSGSAVWGHFLIQNSKHFTHGACARNVRRDINMLEETHKTIHLCVENALSIM